MVLLDITMDQLDGISTLRGIISLDPEANIIMRSSLGTEQNMKSAYDAGAKGFIVKPHLAGLIEEIRGALK
ncbi:response regulator [Salinibacillus xinjiangensis]|uniref:response regulator n=1 Tax=Salinibacillus xinjiangensis TaxID=1229268 RepID=UPI002B277793|nr:response regulator [Salinibacillus xinjiangensis]